MRSLLVNRPRFAQLCGANPHKNTTFICLIVYGYFLVWSSQKIEQLRHGEGIVDCDLNVDVDFLILLVIGRCHRCACCLRYPLNSLVS